MRDVAEQYAALGDARLQLYGIDGLLRPVGEGTPVLAWIDLIDRRIWNHGGTWSWDHQQLPAADVLELGVD